MWLRVGSIQGKKVWKHFHVQELVPVNVKKKRLDKLEPMNFFNLHSIVVVISEKVENINDLNA